MAMHTDIKVYMSSVIESHIDPKTGEVNLTLLAEDAIENFNYFGISEYESACYDLAVDVAENYKAV